MSWENRRYGRYYTRTRRVAGRVIREYCGCGEAAELAAAMDAEKRRERETGAAEYREQGKHLEGIDMEVAVVVRLADLAAKACMLSAGFKNHKGQWRKRRA